MARSCFLNIRTLGKIKIVLKILTKRITTKAERTRILMAKNAFNQKKEFLSKNLNKDVKKRIIKAIIWSVVLYAAETWTYKKEENHPANNLTFVFLPRIAIL